MPSGHESIVNRINPGSCFGSSFSLLKTINSHNSFLSSANSTILFINLRELFDEVKIIESSQIKILKNILTSFAHSNILLNAKLQILAQKTLRDKLIAYFNFLAEQSGSQEFTLPFNREQLSSFINAERSSVCRELSKLANEQIIQIEKNKVKLLNL